MTTPEQSDQFRIVPTDFPDEFVIEALCTFRSEWQDIALWYFSAADLAALRDAIDTVLDDGSGKRVGV